ncbi:hypothetical protein C3L33_05759, partial [Rhododendron williamsianum]
YQTPVNGSRLDECDVSWRFRNKKEKSWRKYRDFRRFKIGYGVNCTYKVMNAKGWHSGINARRPRVRVNGTRSGGNAKVAPPPFRDDQINDTIPVLGSGNDFRKGKYLYYSRGGDYCKGMNHYLWSFLCALGEAQYLNRTFVMDLSICLSATHTATKKDEEGKDFRFYYDFEHLKEASEIVEEGEFLKDWKKWDNTHKKKKIPNKELWPHLDADTWPDALVTKLQGIVQPWRNLYIATNEPFYYYFDKLRSHYKVHLLDDYKELWGNTSEWYNETSLLNGGRPVDFDGYMRVEVDTEVLYRAKTRVETFYNLTSDCKDGINTC